MKSRRLFYCALGCLLAFAPTAAGDIEYFAVFAEGKKIGHGTHARKVAGGKVTTTDTLQMTIARMGTSLTIRTSETTVETADGGPLSFNSVQDMAFMAMTIRGTVDDKGKIHVTITSGATTQQRIMDWPEGALMNEGLRLQQIKKGLKQGTSYTVKMFAGALLGAMEAKVRVGPTRRVDLLGRVLTLTEVQFTVTVPTGGQMTVTSYVDKDLKALKTVMPVAGMNIEVVACSKQVALSKPEAFEAFTKLTVASPVPLGDLQKVKSITYHLAPVGKKTFSIPATDSQTVRAGADGAVIVTIRRGPPAPGAKFPYTGKDKSALAAMKPTRFLQSDNKKVIALARKAAGDAKDTAAAVKRIEQFVRKYIDKKGLSVGYATAAEVAESRQGDCSEHAVLAAAMCRALGIPSRVAVGIVYVSRLGGAKDLFGGHAWAQAFAGGKWVDLDAAMQGFDAGHIALAVGNGNPEDFFQILTSLGYFRIAKVTIEK